MNKIKNLYNLFEATLSNVKFAVVIISLFTIALIYGTFMESYHGADYANRLVYKSWWFILIEIFIFLSVFMATVVRLPPKKRLYGFYTIHAGLIILFIGSFFTYINGIDGSIQLLPNTPAKKIVINEDLLKIHFSKTNTEYKLSLPYTHKKINIDKAIEQIQIEDYIPFGENQIEWIADKQNMRQQHSSTYLLFNQNLSQKITLSLSPDSDFKSMQRMGLLNLHYMPSILKDCFAKKTQHGFILWHLGTGECFTAEEKNLPVDKTEKGTRFLLLKHQGEYLKFFPDVSPVAVNDDLTKNKNTPYRVLSKKIFEEKPNLFLFGEDIAFYDKSKDDWVVTDFKDGLAQLPWMNFQLRLLKHSTTHYPAEVPKAVLPVQENGNIIKGNLKAVKIKFYNKTYWVRNDGPLELTDGKNTIRLIITPKEIEIPYQITLDRFKMNTNPGTNDPASYESFIHLLDGRTNSGLEKHHVFMNNPLKYDDFTFYQSSYFQVGPNQYASVLSVNYDPGRFFKYLGSLLIVLGSIWHYILNRKKRKVSA